jgi:hypothetical protein
MSYVAIDPTAVSTLADVLDAAAEAVDASRLAVDRTLRSVGYAAAAPARLGTVGDAARASATDLRRRVREVRELEILYRHTGERGPVYPRPDTTFPTFAAATAAGDDLGQRFAALFEDGTSWYDGDRVRPLLDELNAHAEDPHFCAAFLSAMPPVVALLWVRQLSDLATRPDFPYDRDHAVAPYLTALGTGLMADPGLLRAYLRPMTNHVLSPGELRDVLRYGGYDDATVLTLTETAIRDSIRGIRTMNWWEDEPGLLDAVLRDPALAQRLIDDLSTDELRTLMGTSEGLLSGFGTVAYVASTGADEARSYAAVEKLVTILGRHGGHVADEVQNGLALAFGGHLGEIGSGVAQGTFPGGLSQDQLVKAFVRVMEDNDTAFATIHEAGADLTGDLLARREAIAASSPDIATLGAVYGLVARADADGAIDRAAATAGLWAMAAQGVALVPLPGPALPGMVAKKAFGTVLSQQADAARARGETEARLDVQQMYEQGRLLLAAAVWRHDQALHPEVTSSLAPPAALLHDDGSLKVYPELDSATERAALREWLARPTPFPVTALDGSTHAASLQEAVLAVDDGFVDGFDRFFLDP